MNINLKIEFHTKLNKIQRTQYKKSHKHVCFYFNDVLIYQMKAPVWSFHRTEYKHRYKNAFSDGKNIYVTILPGTGWNAPKSDKIRTIKRPLSNDAKQLLEQLINKTEI